MSAINDLIDRMTEAEYLSMVDMKWVADRLREFAEEQAHKPMAPAGLMEEIYKVNDEGLRVDFKARVLDILSRYTPQEEKPTCSKWNGEICIFHLPELLDKPTANAGMMSELEILCGTFNGGGKQAVLPVYRVKEIISKYHPVKAPADEGLHKDK